MVGRKTIFFQLTKKLRAFVKEKVSLIGELTPKHCKMKHLIIAFTIVLLLTLIILNLSAHADTSFKAGMLISLTFIIMGFACTDENVK